MKKGKTLPAPTWVGLLKLIEECGELVHIGAKVLDDPTNHSYAIRLQDELADVQAALSIVLLKNEAEFDDKEFGKRVKRKS